MPGPTHFRTVGASGVPAFHEIDGDLPEGATAVDRAPAAGEDFVGGEWVTEHRGVADAQVPAAQIEEARALKYLEALVIASGVELTTGLLKLEADEKDMTVSALAAQVLAKRAAFARAEVQRQRGQSGNHDEYTIPPGDPLAGI